MESAEKVLTTFGKYLKKNILCIPRNVVLPEDKVFFIATIDFQKQFKKNSCLRYIRYPWLYSGTQKKKRKIKKCNI
jgi:hypothetical protein